MAQNLKHFQDDHQSVILTQRACEHLKILKKTRAGDGTDASASMGLRLFVTGGGCSGFRYHFKLCDQPQKNDHVVAYGSVFLALEPTAIPLLKGSKIDYVEEMLGSFFRIENPQAKSACGCGESFGI